MLSVQVDDMTRALENARTAASGSADGLHALTARAEGVAVRLELLVAAMHDLPDPTAEPEQTEAERRLRFVRRRGARIDLEAAE